MLSIIGTYYFDSDEVDEEVDSDKTSMLMQYKARPASIGKTARRNMAATMDVCNENKYGKYLNYHTFYYYYFLSLYFTTKLNLVF